MYVKLIYYWLRTCQKNDDEGYISHQGEMEGFKGGSVNLLPLILLTLICCYSTVILSGKVICSPCIVCVCVCE